MYSLHDVFNAVQLAARTAVFTQIFNLSAAAANKGSAEPATAEDLAAFMDDFDCLGSEWGWEVEKVEPENDTDYRFILHIADKVQQPFELTGDLWDQECGRKLTAAGISIASAYIEAHF